MNVRQLTKVISKEHGFTKALSNRMLDTVLEAIRQELKHNHLVRFRETSIPSHIAHEPR